MLGVMLYFLVFCIVLTKKRKECRGEPWSLIVRKANPGFCKYKRRKWSELLVRGAPRTMESSVQARSTRVFLGRGSFTFLCYNCWGIRGSATNLWIWLTFDDSFCTMNENKNYVPWAPVAQGRNAGLGYSVPSWNDWVPLWASAVFNKGDRKQNSLCSADLCSSVGMEVQTMKIQCGVGLC